MKAFTLYPPEVTYYRQLLTKLQDYGVPNFDDMETFINLYTEWHIKNFSGIPVKASTVLYREAWFIEFVNFLANKDI